MNTQYLTFFVGAEEYAIGILRVREILEFAGATRVPRTPASVLGVINLRGRVVPVIDLARKFGAEPSAVTSRTCVVLVDVEIEGESLVVGLLADSVHEVVEIAPEAIEPPPSFGTRMSIEFLQGIGRYRDHFVLILEIDRVLSTLEAEGVEMIVAAEEPAAATA